MIKITHVLILGVPQAEGKKYEGKTFEVGNLPEGFAVKATYGDAFLTYHDDGTIRTACSRNFFEHRPDGSWLRWPFLDNLSPKEAWREHLSDERRRS